MSFGKMLGIVAVCLLVVAASLAIYTANMPVAAAVDDANADKQTYPQVPVRYETPDEGQFSQIRPKPLVQGSNGMTVSEWAAEQSDLELRDHVVPTKRAPNRIQKDDLYVPLRPTTEFHRGEWMIRR